MSPEQLSIYKKIKFLYQTKEGKEVLDIILKETRHNVDVFNSDPVINAYNQGKQAIGFWLKKIIEKELNE